MFQFTIRRASDEAAAGVLVVADSRDVVVWERGRAGRSVTKLLAEPNMSDSYQLAYIAARRQGLLPDCSRDDFETGWLLVFGQDAAPDPTQPVP